MADGDAEKKNIAKLDFKIDDAINSLDLIDKKLKSIAETSGKFSTKISENIGKGISVNVNTDDLKKNLVNVENMTKASRERLTLNTIKEEQKHQNKMSEIVAKGEQQRQNYAAKTATEQEKYNERVAKSTESLYDKITQYAKTYVIYQGFNELKKAISETIDEMVEMEQQMVAIDRVLNESGLDINAYRDKLIQLAYDYGNTFNNVADITLRLAQAGFSSNEAIKLTEKTLLALNTAELNATQATDDMVAVMAQWGLMTGSATEKAEQYGAIIDKINKVADKYPTTSADIMDALKKVSSAFNLAGASIDETIATIVAAEKASQRGGKVIGTALSNIVQQLKAEKKLDLAEQLGLDFFEDDAKTKFKPIMEIFQEMANRMEKLKAEGKESSVEMQQLLEMFTVFRRNIGASLLGEMSGEDSTYLNVLNDSLTAVGYSLQENEKYMKTAKAAQAQFNAELLKLKTEIWDNGLETTFRDMLSLGTDVIKGIDNIIKKFGIMPTTIGTAVLAYTALNKKIQGFTYDTNTSSIQLNGFFKTVAEGTQGIRNVNKACVDFMNVNATMGEKIKNNAIGFAANTKEMIKYGAGLVANTAKTIALQVATIALNTAISMGLSLAITAIVTAINNWIHSEENAIEKSKELQKTAEDNATTFSDESKELKQLRKEYEELAKKDNRTTEENQKIYELQTQINGLIKDTGKQVDLVNVTLDEQGKRVLKINDAYDKQLEIIKSIEYEKKRQATEELRIAAENAERMMKGINTSDWNDFWGEITSAFGRGGIDFNKESEYRKDIAAALGYGEQNGNNQLLSIGWEDFGKLDFDKQLKYLNEWNVQLERASKEGKDVSKALDWVKESLANLNEKQKNARDATERYIEALGELYTQGNNLSSFQTAISGILDTYGEDEGVKNIANSIQELNEKFSNGEIKATDYFNNLRTQIDNIKNTTQKDGEEISAGMQALFAETTRYLAEGIEATQLAFDDGTITFYEYGESLAQANQGLLELYATQNDLTYNADTGKWFNEQKNQVDDYANSLQDAINTVSEFSQMLKGLGDSYDYIAEHATAAGEANFQMEDITSQSYQNLANNFADSLAKMRKTNYEAWSAITQNVFESTGKTANEVEDVDNYVKNALLTNSNNLNTSLTDANKMAQQAASNLGKATGKLIQNLSKVIENFDYTIKFETTGGINPGGNILDLVQGKTFKPKSDLALKITGTAGKNVQSLAESLSTFGTEFEQYVSSAAYNQYKSLLENINPYTSANSSDLTDTTGGGSGSRPSGGSGGSGGSGRSSSSRDTSERDATKAEEDAYKARLAAFKDYISEKERLENRWVNKQKELGQLSTNDYLFITQQRIERYKKYLEEIEKATWMHEEDRLALEKQYSEKIEDLQVDYFGYLEDKLNEDIKALKEANSEKIQQIKDEATERINALKKVEKENDRIREKEEYEKRRQEHLDDIAYWEQRTGRQAQEALKEAKKNLKELDEQWEQQMEDWSIEDQIKAIEEERDAQIQAIEDAQEAEIEAMKAIYNERVQEFLRTGEIIYDEAGVHSKRLYLEYKENFIDPIINDLKKLNETATKQSTVSTPEPTPEPEQQYETYVIQRGDTLTSIARKFGTTIQKILDANPYVTNPNLIYAGKTLEIPKFHEGGIAGGEGFALLKPEEVVLKPEWAASLNRMMKYFDNVSKGNIANISNGPSIEVKGDLVKIEANIKNRTDADYLAKRVENILKDKFNIKK